MVDQRDEVSRLTAEITDLQKLVIMSNDATFGLAAILGRTLVDAGLLDRVEFAATIEQRAGPVGAEDHNLLLATFARAVRMNFPGGRFDVIDGGKPIAVDSD